MLPEGERHPRDMKRWTALLLAVTLAAEAPAQTFRARTAVAPLAPAAPVAPSLGAASPLGLLAPSLALTLPAAPAAGAQPRSG